MLDHAPLAEMLSPARPRAPEGAGSNADAVVRAICAEYDIAVVPQNVFPMPGQTRAVSTLCQILQKHGEGHLRLVLTTLGETRDNNALIDRFSLWAVSDLIISCPEWVEKRTDEWLEWWDRIPLGPIMATVNELRGHTQQRHALAGAIYYHLSTYARQSLATKGTGGSHLIREARKVRMSTQVKRIEAGRRLIEIKAQLPRGHWVPWVYEHSGLSMATVLKYMRLAREAG